MATLIQTLWGQKPTPVGFAVKILPQYCEYPDGHVLTHPGSVFEGSVRFLLSGPMTIRTLRLVFRASERVNYDAMGWGKIEKSDGRIFSLRATLASADTVLSEGTHVYPFTVEMPMVNYPPTFQHHMIASQILLVAHMEYCYDQKEDLPQSCESDPYPVNFLPILETNNASLAPKRGSPSINRSLHNDHLHHFIKNEHGHLVLPTTRFNVQNTEFIPVQLGIAPASPQHIRLQLRRHLTIIHGSNRRTIADPISTCYLHTSASPLSSPISYTRLVLPPNCAPSVTFSDRFQIVYQLTVSVKIKHGFIPKWKKLFEVPITLGTLPEGTWAPEDLVKYNDPCIAIEPTGRWKPRFLRASHHEEGLPAYDCTRPPDYSIIITH